MPRPKAKKNTPAAGHPVGRPPAAFVLIRAGAVMTPGGTIPDGAVLARGRRIIAVGTYKKVEAAVRRLHNRSKRFLLEVYDRRGLIAVPGFIDIHQHGGGGADYMDADPDAVRTALLTHAREGTTAVIPTLMTASRRHTEKAARAIDEVRRQARRGTGRPEADGGPAVLPDILGLHLEGPHIAAEKRGAQPEGPYPPLRPRGDQSPGQGRPNARPDRHPGPGEAGRGGLHQDAQGPGHHRLRGALGRDFRTGAGRLRSGDQPRHPPL